MKKLAIKRAHCSYYENVKSKQNRVITLAQFVTAIRSERWKKAVEDFRRYMAEGKDGEAKRIKEGLPGIVSAGVCEGADEILARLGKMYVADERFKKNIDKYREGTAKFAAEGVRIYVEKK